MTKVEAKVIAGRLGRSQKAVILALSEDWGRAPCHQTAKRLWYRQERLIDHKHQTGNCWCLTNLGLSVRAILQQNPSPVEPVIANSKDVE